MFRALISTSRTFSAVVCAAGILVFAAARGAEVNWPNILLSTPSTGERSLGSADAPVVVVEYASATCPHCALFHVKVWPEIRRQYVDAGNVRWIIRELPLDSLAMAAFMLARCVSSDRYFPTLELLFAQQKLWMDGEPRNELQKIMAQIGMSREQFNLCLEREDLSQSIYQTAKIATEEFGVKSTPTFFVNGQIVRGTQDFAFFKELIDNALKKAAVQ